MPAKKPITPAKKTPVTIPGRHGGTLKPCQPGENRNPKGRGKGTLNTKTVLRKWLELSFTAANPVTSKKEKMTALDAMTAAQIGKALQGDTKAFTALLDRFEGKPRQKVELTGEDGGPIQQEISSDIDYDALDTETLRKIAAARKPKHG